ncbi:hypothetical protein MRB53_017352 [Persea americana]|uniref:Uncharacterized protein n=1 Tax=Persea americana TaxID=3435 RepID=A0ACC2M4Y1_PERAE|nr:hypothetical protein MRB53_017352 [Persea americana]
MRFSLLQHQLQHHHHQQSYKSRRSSNFRAPSPIERIADYVFNSNFNFKSTSAIFWLVLQGLCCLISLVFGFRFSRLLLFLLLSPAPAPVVRTTPQTQIAHPRRPSHPANRTVSRSFIGRHDILIRSWTHPNPAEVVAAHLLMQAVQIEQRRQVAIKNPKTIIAVTPTYVRTLQALHLTGLLHSLMLVPYKLVWIVVEAGGVSNETATILAGSRLRTIHAGFDEPMPKGWDDRNRIQARMRIQALRIIREQRLDGIILFADDSNIHSMELFDEIQSVNWIGAISMGVLAHSGLPQASSFSKDMSVPIQGPACDLNGQLVGWHTINSLPNADNATYMDDKGTVLPKKLEWAGIVLNSRLVWKEAEGKPEWVRDLDLLGQNVDELDSPLYLLNDSSFIEPLGKCGQRVLMWWLRVEAWADSTFPSGWIIDPPLEITISANSTVWHDARPENAEKHPRKAKNNRPRHSSRKRKNESNVWGTSF